MISEIVFLESFGFLEEQDTLQNIERVRNALLAELKSFDNFIFDWAAWDDTYEFVKNENQEYIESNLVDETFIGSEINLIMYIDESGELVFSKAFDFETEEEIPIPETLQEHTSPNSLLVQHSSTDSTIKGLVLLPEGPIMLVSHPIVQSNEEGPIRGTLIMGRYFDSVQLEKLAETTQIALDMQLLNSQQISANFQGAILELSGEENKLIKTVTSDVIAGYTIIEDIYGEPCLVIEAQLPRSIYNQGNSSITYFVLLLLSTVITFSVVIMLFLEKTILSRLAQLNNSVKKIANTKETHEKQVTVKGKDDEITSLADEINKMLTTVEEAQNKLQITNEKLSVVGNFTRHDVRNKLASILNNVYLIKKKMKTDDPKTMERLKNIEVLIEHVNQIFEFAKTYEMLGVEKLEYIDVENCVEEGTRRNDLNDIEIINDCKGLTVLADSLLQQLFYNLVDDTIKHSEHATQIRIFYKEEDYQLNLVYEDNGIGISEAEKKKIFQEGYGKGTGYGLYLIRKICETYGWSINETGKPNICARFVMAIPKINNKGKKNYYLKSDSNKPSVTQVPR
jgi:sensor domain CHASE-containing protein